jgi:hypothetical protein
VGGLAALHLLTHLEIHPPPKTFDTLEIVLDDRSFVVDDQLVASTNDPFVLTKPLSWHLDLSVQLSTVADFALFSGGRLQLLGRPDKTAFLDGVDGAAAYGVWAFLNAKKDGPLYWSNPEGDRTTKILEAFTSPAHMVAAGDYFAHSTCGAPKDLAFYSTVYQFLFAAYRFGAHGVCFNRLHGDWIAVGGDDEKNVNASNIMLPTVPPGFKLVATAQQRQ